MATGNIPNPQNQKKGFLNRLFASEPKPVPKPLPPVTLPWKGTSAKGWTVRISKTEIVWENSDQSVARLPISHISEVSVFLKNDEFFKDAEWYCRIIKHNGLVEWTQFMTEERAKRMVTAVRLAMGV